NAPPERKPPKSSPLAYPRTEAGSRLMAKGTNPLRTARSKGCNRKPSHDQRRLMRLRLVSRAIRTENPQRKTKPLLSTADASLIFGLQVARHQVTDGLGDVLSFVKHGVNFVDDRRA